MNQRLFSSLICCLFSCFLLAQQGYDFKIKIDGYTGKEAFLGYHYGDKQYLKDTVAIDSEGFFRFKGEEALEGGIYLVVMPPDNNFIQVLINEQEQRFSMETKVADPVANMQTKNAPDNQLFYSYMQMLSEKRPQAEALGQQMEQAKGDEAQTKILQGKMEQLNKDVVNYQLDVIRKHPQSLTAAIIKAAMDIDMPEFEGEDADRQRWLYVKSHWFDNINMGDPRLLRSPIQFSKIDHYLEKLTVQIPDSITKSIDTVLQLVAPAEESFKFYLIHFLNKYAKSKIVGMDAVYVHIAEKYYKTGRASWTEEEQLNKIIENAKTLKPLLIGKIAPDLKMYRQDNSTISLHEVNAPITVLFFWDPDCGHCKKSMPDMLSFYEKYKPKGVEVFAICTKVGKDFPKCWDIIEEKKMGGWINVGDQYLRSRYKGIYDIRNTPQIYVLDENKEILSKRIGAEQLEEVIDQIIKRRDEEKQKAIGLGDE